MHNLYRKYGKRWFDVFATFIGLVLLSPLFILLSIAIKLTSNGPVFFKQERIGKNFVPFKMIKFRSMIVNDANSNQLVTSSGDPRITPIGKVLRRYKLDELPQLVNVMMGDMSLVGPRPEVMRYIKHHKKEYEFILSIQPGITDNAAIAFKNEEDILAQYDDPETAYVEKIMPKKIALYKAYIQKQTLLNDIGLILKTIF
jgi:lipopolysaccharide/colanic/teichoic acid biosynthesis glycosyltransferase